MVVMKNFTLVAMPKSVANDPVAKRRAKLLEQLELRWLGKTEQVG